MITRTKALAIRRNILGTSNILPDNDAWQTPELFPPWGAGINVVSGERYQYLDKLYKVIQSHTTQEGWEPDKTPALFTEVSKPGEIPEWKQPTGAQDAYMTGDKVRHNDHTWVSDIDNNVWEPGVYGWTQDA